MGGAGAGMEGPYAASPIVRPDGSTVPGSGSGPHAAAAATSSHAPLSHQSSTADAIATEERDGFRNIPRVKEWFDKGDAIAAVDIQANEEELNRGDMAGTGIADQLHAQFNEAAIEEEKLYLFWFNDHLQTLGVEQVSDLHKSLKSGVQVIRVLEHVGETKAPSYQKNPRFDVQRQDNWRVVKKFMEKLGIPVEEEGEGEDYVAALDPEALFNGDRREMLKLFSKLMMYEAKRNPGF
jgi:hypothetical protein